MLEFNPMPAKQKYFFNLLLICAFNFNPVSAQEKSLENTSWQLIAIYGFNNSEFIPNRSKFISAMDENRLTLNYVLFSHSALLF